MPFNVRENIEGYLYPYIFIIKTDYGIFVPFFVTFKILSYL